MYVCTCTTLTCIYLVCRLEYWNRNGYSSLNVAVDSDSEEAWSDSDEEGEGVWSAEINYTRGDVTHPQNTGTSDLIIVHCVGKCHILCIGRPVRAYSVS